MPDNFELTGALRTLHGKLLNSEIRGQGWDVLGRPKDKVLTYLRH